MTEQDITKLQSLCAAKIQLSKAFDTLESAGMFHLLPHIDSILSDLQFEKTAILDTGPLVEFKK